AQIRSIHEGMRTWAGSHQGKFPLPSAIDTANQTIAGSLSTQRNKDNTGNIFSILIFNHLLTPEMALSPAETSASFLADTGYQYSSPSPAAAPANALWDPGFAGTPSDITNRRSPGFGNFSYAHLIPFASRQSQWRDDAAPSVALLSNRGPVFDGT